jgi:hypothetical protein
MTTDNTSELTNPSPTLLNEIMKGSYLLYKNYYIDGRDRLFYVVGFDTYRNCIELSNGDINLSTHISNLKKIPLSDEMLLRLGFRKFKGQFGDDYCLVRDGVEIYFTIEHWNNIEDKDSKYYNNWFIKHTINPHKIKYIHELQILFFALTGEHLVIDKI